MTEKEACRILGILPGTGMKEAKRRYRQLMLQVHPDIGESAGGGYAYNAQEINLAFSVLKKSLSAGDGASFHNGEKKAAERTMYTVWDAPVNGEAYMEREILHYAEDYDGTFPGTFCIAKGKYLWKTEEDFPLFLRSLYKCSQYLLDKEDYRFPWRELPSLAVRQQFQAELTYLLARQFTDGIALLGELTKEKAADKDGNRIFYASAMLEPADPAAVLETGQMLNPSGFRRHRLYLKDQSGKELGYLSFPDDRLYYIVVPLLEQKKARIRIQAAGNCLKLHLWLKLQGAVKVLPENLNLQIERLLDQYRK